MLRTKYLDRDNPLHATFHSVVLVGVHDIKNLQYKIRAGQTTRLNSPWNIAVDFEVDMSFSPKEIAPMLDGYAKAEKVIMDIPAIAQRLYYHTTGHPYLVTRLCRIIAKNLLPQKKNLG